MLSKVSRSLISSAPRLQTRAGFSAGFHTNRVTLAGQTKGQAPQSSRKPIGSTPKASQQGEHIHHKTDPTSPDTGRGAAADEPTLPSHSMPDPHKQSITTPENATPDLYLKDDSVETAAGGLTEDEGAGDTGLGSGHVYVVSEGSESYKDVPTGAYSSINAYEQLPTTEAPKKGPGSSTSPDPTAHPALSKRASRLEDGVGSSSAVRFRGAPGDMKRGGNGGLGLQAGAKATENTLDERNPAPTSEMGEMGIHEAWKHRK